jgi:hypothetical protein
MATPMNEHRSEEIKFDLGGDRFFVVLQHQGTVDIHIRKYRRTDSGELRPSVPCIKLDRRTFWTLRDNIDDFNNAVVENGAKRSKTLLGCRRIADDTVLCARTDGCGQTVVVLSQWYGRSAHVHMVFAFRDE